MLKRLVFSTLLLASASGWFLLAAEARPIIPGAPTPLFNGRDLTGFTTWNREQGRSDPDRVFSVVDRVDGAPAIRISGQYFGGLITKESFADYHLIAEWRWGLVTWGRGEVRSGRDSGILLHCQGEEGSAAPDFRSAWMRSIEYQIIEGGTGDIILVRGHERGKPHPIFATMRATVVPGTRRWAPDGVLTDFGAGRNRTDWWRKDPEWKNAYGFRGRGDVESTPGEWNRTEAICRANTVIYLLNGVKVNAAQDISLSSGRILFQSEGAEIFFRRIELRPLAPEPAVR